MSRSIKHYPILKQEKKDVHYCNRKIRHDKLAEVPSGAAYRKISKSWPVWEYRWTKGQAEEEYMSNSWMQEKYSLTEWLNYWAKCALRK